MRVTFTNDGRAPGRVAEAEVHFTLDAETRATLEQVLAEAPGNPEIAEAVVAAARQALLLDGLKLVGFAVWERQGGSGRNVTFPSRAYTINGERRSFALLRPAAVGGGPGEPTMPTDKVRDVILAACAAWEGQQ